MLTSGVRDRCHTLGALLSNFGGYLCAQKKLEEAEPVLVRALNTLEHTLGRNNEYTLSCLTNYARLLRDLGRTEQLDALKTNYSNNRQVFWLLDVMDKVQPLAMPNMFGNLNDKQRPLFSFSFRHASPG